MTMAAKPANADALGLRFAGNPEIRQLRDRHAQLGLANHHDVTGITNELAAALSGDDDNRINAARLLLDAVTKKALEEREITAAVDAAAVAQLPADAIAHDEIRSAVESHQASVRAASDAKRELAELERDRPAAERADVEALADALSAGKADPGPKHAAKLDKQIEQARRTVEAATFNEARGLTAVNVSLVEHLPEWQETAAESAAHARRSFLDALDALETERISLGQALSLQWLVSGQARTFNPAGLTVPAPRASDNDRASVDELLGLLRALGEEQKPTVVPHPALRSVDDYDAA